MTTERWFVLDVNPEPWAIGPVGYSRRGGKMSAYVGRNQQLHSYQEAVREALGTGHEMIDGPFQLYFWFWRRRDEYKTPQSRTHRKHEADATNLQKATEDALQGVLFKNDKDTRIIRSVMVEQGPDVEGKIVFQIKPIENFNVGTFPLQVQQQIDELALESRQSDLYHNAEEIF